MILWFRRDLRVKDSTILSLAKGEVLPIFIFDKNILDKLDRDDKRVTFIFESVLKLKRDLQSIGLNLAIFFAKPIDVFKYLKDDVIASIDFDEYAISRDKEVAKVVNFSGVNDSFLFEKNDILKDDSSPYKVFTPYYKKILTLFGEEFYFERQRNSNLKLKPFDYEHIIEIDEVTTKKEIDIKSIGFEKVILADFATTSPQELLNNFKSKVINYKEDRDFFNLNATSKLSVHLRFGTISIREVIRTLKEWQNEGYKVADFFRELMWREFFNYILIHFPYIQKRDFVNMNPKWENDKYKIELFKEAKTGIPIVDAGIMELKESGYMHNRVRMVVASFLIKHLQVDWRIGEEFFAKYLLDYEASSNIGSWQWVNAQPHFKTLNPYLQSKKFDKNGEYIKKWLPKLKTTPTKFLYNEEYLLKYKIKDYPTPIVIHKNFHTSFKN